MLWKLLGGGASAPPVPLWQAADDHFPVRVKLLFEFMLIKVNNC